MRRFHDLTLRAARLEDLERLARWLGCTITGHGSERERKSRAVRSVQRAEKRIALLPLEERCAAPDAWKLKPPPNGPSAACMKECGCGQVFTRAEFIALEPPRAGSRWLIPGDDGDDDLVLEARNCRACGSTITMTALVSEENGPSIGA